MKFNYRARTKTGQIQSGIVEASSKEAAIELLRSFGLYVTSIREEASLPFYAREIRFLERISQKEIAAFSRQLSVMLESGVPPVEALEVLARQTKNESLKEKILVLAEKIEGGLSFSKALSLYPKVFTPFYIGMVKSGEASGKFSEVFSYLADHLEREENFRSQVKGAMIYPSLVLIIFFIILAMMNLFVIPRLAEVFQEADVELPLVTKIVISFSDFFRKAGWLLIIILIVAILFLRSFARQPAGKSIFDRIFLKIPLLGDLLEKIYLARLAENLSTLIAGGLPITNALEITAEIVGNEVYKEIILEARDEVKEGGTISQALQRYPQAVPPFFIQMVSVGEKTGSLDRLLRNIVGLYQSEIERALNNFLRLLEPLLIVFLGLIVAGLMAAIILPLYQRFTF